MRTVVNCLFLVAILAFPAMAEKPCRKGPATNIILFGWDGAQREHVQQCLERDELPTLKMLSEEGALVDVDVVTGATDTKAGWSQILTGYHPQVTGVYSNGRYRDIPAGLSIFERLKEHFGPDDVVVVLFHDHGSRYVGKIYNDDWMRAQGFLEADPQPENH